MRTKQLLTLVCTATAVLAVSGCATTGQPNRVEQLQAENQALRSKLDQSEQTITQLKNREMTASAAQGNSALPPRAAAKPGTCWTRVYIPPEYDTYTERVIVEEASKRVTVTEPEYKMVTRRVMVQEASKVTTVVPAQYETRTERVMVEPAHTVWKPGRGAIERVNPKTGQIMCLVTVPAEYKTITKRVMVQQPHVVTKKIPAEYKTIRVKKMVQPPETVVHKMPAEYGSVTKRRLVDDGSMEWRRVVCKTNATHELVAQIQRALQQAGFDPGAIDGVIGPNTLQAVSNYQDAHGLANGGITIKTVKSLGVEVPNA